MIDISNLSFRYPGAAEDTLRNVNLHIEEGDFVAVVGGNGSGKTTMCKSLNGLIPHYWSGEFAGSVHVDGIDTFHSSVAELSSIVGYVYQDFQNQLVRPTIRDEISFGPINYGRADFAERTSSIMTRLRIDHLADRFVWQLSGGQAHLTALASVLALEPRVVVVDEPVAELDPARATEVYERLTELNRTEGLTVITIEHNAEFIARYASSVVLMADGAPVWHLPVDEAVNRADELARHGIPAPQIVRACHELGIREAPRTVEAAATLLARDRIEIPNPPREPVGVPGGREVASAEKVSHSYRSVGGDLTPVLTDLSLSLREGEKVALVGGNGSGKTTLLRLLGGIIVPREGTITVEGINTRSRSGPEMTEVVAYLYQHPEQMFLKPSLAEDIELFPKGRNVEHLEAKVNEVLTRVRLHEFKDRDGRMLSGGQQRRATLAIGLLMAPTLLLLDEPTSSLDVRSRDDVTDMLASLADVISCAVVATHDMQLVAEWANRVIVLEGGAVAADVHPRELFANPELLAKANLVPPQITSLGLSLGMELLPLSVEEFTDFYRGNQ